MFSFQKTALVLCCSSLALAGCGDGGILGSLGKSDEGLQVSSACEIVEPGNVEDGEVMTYDDLLANVAEETPGGFGGVSVDDETLIIYLQEPENQEAAKKIQEKLAEVLERPEFADYAIRISEAQYDFAQLNQWKELGSNILGMSNMTSLDIDENRLVFGVEPDPENMSFEEARTCVMANVENLDIPREAVRVVGQKLPQELPIRQ